MERSRRGTNGVRCSCCHSLAGGCSLCCALPCHLYLPLPQGGNSSLVSSGEHSPLLIFDTVLPCSRKGNGGWIEQGFALDLIQVCCASVSAMCAWNWCFLLLHFSCWAFQRFMRRVFAVQNVSNTVDEYIAWYGWSHLHVIFTGYCYAVLHFVIKTIGISSRILHAIIPVIYETCH